MANRVKQHKFLGGFRKTHIFQKYHYLTSDLTTRVQDDSGTIEALTCGSDQVDELDSIDVLSDASLIITPNAYKSGVLYAVKPIDGDGDLTWDRASDATRVNSDGEIETAFVLGDEAVTNGDFATDTDWTYIQPTSGSVSISGGALRLISLDGSFCQASQTGVMTIGKKYLIEVNVTSVTGSFRVRPNAQTPFFSITTPGIHRLEYITTSTAIVIERDIACDVVIESISVKEVITQNVPRLNYPVGGGCPSVLLEPQRTNLITYSEDLTDASWVKTNSTITANDATSPDGTVNASKLVEDSTLATDHRLRNISVSGLTATNLHTVSIFVKPAGRSHGRLFNVDSASVDGAYVDFDLVSGTIGTPTAIGAGTDLDSTIKNVGNGWYRVSLTCVMNNAKTTGRLKLYLSDGTSPVYDGDGTSGLYVYGGQFEVGAFSTTYIPTSGSTVTRLKDEYELTNVYTNGLVTASGGAWLIKLKNNIAYLRDASGRGMFIGDTVTASTNGIRLIFKSSTARVTVQVYTAGVAANVYDTTTDDCNLLFNWDGVTLDIWENGIKVLSGIVWTATALEYFGAVIPSAPIEFDLSTLFPAPLSDDDAAAITSFYGSYTAMALGEGYNLILDA